LRRYLKVQKVMYKRR